MSETQRYTNGNTSMKLNGKGGWVKYDDHVAALKAARNELPDVGSWSPERKFKIGNQVTHRDSKKVRKIKNYYFSSEDNEWKYDIGFYYVESELTLHVPPTPAELIPTLKEHEWVRGTTITGESFEGYVIFNNGNTFGGVRIIGFDYSTSPGYIKTIKRCDKPEVK